MSNAIPLDMIGGFGRSPFPQFSPEETVNLYVVSNPQGKNGKSLFPRSGLASFVNLNRNKSARLIYPFKEFLFAVIGEEVYLVSKVGVPTLLGRINTNTGYIGVDNNDYQLIIVDGVDAWVYNANTGAFTQVLSAGLPDNPQDVTSLAQRFIINDGQTNTIAYSDINNGETWNALNFFEMTAYPDTPVGVRTLKGRLFVMGERSVETWYDAGDAYLPYRRDNPAIEFGCAAVGSIAEGEGYLCWLSQTINGVSSIVLSNGGEPIPVSSQAINNEIESYEDVSDARAYIYKNEIGHVFYIINFTNANRTWQFHINSQLPLEERWSQLAYLDDDRFRGESHAYFNGKHYVSDYEEAKIYELSPLIFDDDGINIRRARISKIVNFANIDKFVIGKLQVDLVQGTGDPDDSTIYVEDADPVLFLSVSRDGGISYGNQLKQSIGKVGQRKWETVFYNLGHSNQFVFKVEYYNKRPFSILGASVVIAGDNTPGRS